MTAKKTVLAEGIVEFTAEEQAAWESFVAWDAMGTLTTERDCGGRQDFGIFISPGSLRLNFLAHVYPELVSYPKPLAALSGKLYRTRNPLMVSIASKLQAMPPKQLESVSSLALDKARAALAECKEE